MTPEGHILGQVCAVRAPDRIAHTAELERRIAQVYADCSSALASTRPLVDAR